MTSSVAVSCCIADLSPCQRIPVTVERMELGKTLIEDFVDLSSSR
jgi:hypothetical protein